MTKVMLVTGASRGIGAEIALGRAGSAAEVAQVALWLASDAASYVHGTVVDVAGGR